MHNVARHIDRLTHNGHAGKWSTEETLRLVQIMQDFQEHGKVQTAPKFWKEVSVRMEDVRTPDQCRNKWLVYGIRWVVCD